MRISCLLLAAYAALSVAAPAQQRAGLQLVARTNGAAGPMDVDGKDDKLWQSPEPEDDPMDLDYNPNRATSASDWDYRLGFWTIHGVGETKIKMRAENTYPSYTPSFVRDDRNDKIRNYDYSPDINDWSLAPVSRADALNTARVLSSYLQFRSRPPTDAEIDLKFDIGGCPGGKALNQVETDDNPVYTGLSSGSGFIPGQKDDASFYNTEHVYEKQIISKFFQSVFTTDKGAEWFKVVAENDLHKYFKTDTADPEPLYPLDAKLWSATPAPAGWKSYKVLNKALGDVVDDVEPSSHGSLATALGAVVGSDFRRDHLTALEAELNSAKGRIFRGNEVHSEEKLKNLGNRKCVKNAQLLDKDADPDAAIVFKDRMNLIKQPVVIWKYVLTPEVWEKFASTSSEVYRLLKIFDNTYAALQGTTKVAKAALAERKGIAVSEWSKTGMKTLPTGKKNLAQAYKDWLPTYLNEVIEKSAAFKDTSITIMKKLNGNGPNAMFTDDHVKLINKEWTNYSATKLKAAVDAKISECFMG